jgi:hypothetical protein
VGVYRQLVANMKAHFGDDAKGRWKAFYFLPWHFSFFHRYRPLPEAAFGEVALQHPLVGRRLDLLLPEVRGGVGIEGGAGVCACPFGNGAGAVEGV